jgi:hypothetical protein
MYDYDRNFIAASPIKNCSKECILEAYKEVFHTLKQAGLRPKLACLDNKCSQLLKEYLTSKGVDYQIAPPYIHRRNAAERAIQTLKNHIIAGLRTCDDNFPLHLWDRLLPQAILTLNLLQGSRINPRLSAYTQVHGQYIYNTHPLDPPGTKVLVHKKSDNRKTWAPHTTEGWYMGSALEHYRCYRIWNPATRHIRIADTLTWLPSKVPLPIANDSTLIMAALHSIATIAKRNEPSNISLLSPEQAAKSIRLRAIFTLPIEPCNRYSRMCGIKSTSWQLQSHRL